MPTEVHPVWRRSSGKVTKYAKWLTGGTDTQGDLSRRGHRHYEHSECRFCDSREEETREHLLSECQSTAALRADYAGSIGKICQDKLKEFEQLPHHRRWIWILAGSTIREEEFIPKNTNRIPSAAKQLNISWKMC